MTDYKDTLNLPKTEFPMKAGLAQREPAMLARWQSLDIYHSLRKKRAGQEKYILHDGPPYANGKIHLGHAVNKILKDIVVKSQSLNGYDAPYIPGWDCHGLPIELNVEKKLGKPGQKVSPVEFRQACREYAQSQITLQSEAFQRLGVFGDWEHPYLTMNFSYEANIIRSLAKIIDHGHLRHGFKPVHWCLDCCSALAEAEVEYQDKKSQAVDVCFTVVDQADFIESFEGSLTVDGPIFIPIWTTTPWTLPANQAVALHPKLHYVLVKAADKTMLVAEALLEAIVERYGFDKYEIIATCSGEDLDFLKLKHPFLEREVPIVMGEHVTVDAGTGAVHTAPAHGQDDYEVAKKYGLPVDNPVGPNGCYTQYAPILQGEHVIKANKKIIELMKERGVLWHLEEIQHSYPHCWRHKSPLIFRATPQWFISMEHRGLRDKAIKALDKTHWIPDWGQARITGMVKDRPDWCISRQRTWGVPITLFVDKETSALHPDTPKLMKKAADLVEKKGIDAWFDLDASDWLGGDAAQYHKVTDVLDVWFDSGVTHACVLRQREVLQFPADLYLEGSDQHRGWFQTSLLSSVGMTGEAPYKAVLTHGFTVDAKGRKMSKSLGNVVSPDQVINRLGADVLRWWIASTDYRGEITISDEILKRASETYRRLRNTARFLLSNLHDFNPEKDLLDFKDMLALDRWAVDRSKCVQDALKIAYDGYQFHQVYQKLHHFCAMDMGSFYLDILKDRLYTMKANARARRSAQTAMYHILEALVRWISPILAFTADEIWQYMPGKRAESVFFETWYDGLETLAEKDSFNRGFWKDIMVVRDEVNKILEESRNAGDIGSALAAEISLYCEPKYCSQLCQLGDEARFVFITSNAKIFPMAENQNARKTAIEGLCVDVIPSSYQKCARCWHRREDVGSHKEHAELCGRCVENVKGDGEQRLYA